MKRDMSWMKFYRALPLALALMALPAWAQFDVNPDHFDAQPAARTMAAAPQAISLQQQQIATEQTRLNGYRKQIVDKAADVEHARQLLISPAGSADEAGESIALAVQQKQLDELKKSLAGPMQESKLRIARLQKDQNAVGLSIAKAPASVHKLHSHKPVMMAASR